MSGGKGGGSSSGLSDMVNYGNQALALQKDIYNETKGVNSPYIQAGNAGINELLMRMGLSSPSQTGAARSRDAIYNEMLPKYTSQTASQTVPSVGQGYKYKNNAGQWVDATFGYGDPAFNYQSMGQITGDASELARNRYGTGNAQLASIREAQARYNDMLKKGNVQGAQSGSTVDYTGLNNAVDAAYAAQSQGNAAASNPLYGSLLKSFSMEDYQADPGYQFRLSEGNKALERQLAARGQFSSMNPAAAKALQAYGQDMASQEYGAAYDRYNINQGNIYNRLANLAGMGQTAVGTQAGVGGNYANAGTDILTSMGNATAASKQAAAANKGSMFNTLLGAGAQLGSAYLMSDRRLKVNIKKFGEHDGINLYKFNYDPQNSFVNLNNLPTDKTYIGVMADEIDNVYPEAVIEKDGYKAVNYSMLGLEMKEVNDAA